MARHAVEHRLYPPIDKFILLNPHPDMKSPPFVKLFDVEALEYVNAVPSVDQQLMIKTISAWAKDIFDRYNMAQYTWYEKQGCKHCFSITPGLKPNEITICNTVLVDYFAQDTAIRNGRAVYPRFEFNSPTSLVRISAA